MKKTVILISIISLFLCSFTSCFAPKDKVVSSLGKYTTAEFYSEGSFQDYTDYAKYHFEGSVDLSDNEYFEKITSADKNVFDEHLDDFEGLIDTYRENDASREIVANYDFQRTLIDGDDYLHIQSEKTALDDDITVLVNYDIYFFDVQTNTLYHFHNNV